MNKKLGEILVEQGAVRPEDVDEALGVQTSGDGRRLGELLSAAVKVSSAALARALAAQHGLPFVQLEQVSPEVAALVPMELQRQHALVPFRDEGRGKAVHVAVADPSTKDVLTELEFQLGRPLLISVASPEEIASVHAALEGDVVPAVILDEGEPAATEPLAPLPAKSPSQTLAKVQLKRVAVPVGTPPHAVPAFAADVPPLELPSPPVRPRTGDTAGRGLPALLMTAAPAAAPLSQRPATTSADPKAKRTATKSEPGVSAHKPPLPEPATSPRKPRTAPRLPKVSVPGDAWAVKEVARALPPVEEAPARPAVKTEAAAPAGGGLPNLFDDEPSAPTETARVAKQAPSVLDAVPPTDTTPLPKRAAASAPRAPTRTSAQYPGGVAPAAEAKAVAADPWAPVPTSRGTVKTTAQFLAAREPLPDAAPAASPAPSPRAAETTPSAQFLVPEAREQAKTGLAWSDKSAPLVGADMADTAAFAQLPAWMRDGGEGAGASDPLTAAVEKAVLVSGAPKTVARLLRLLVDRGLLTEEEILEELGKP